MGYILYVLVINIFMSNQIDRKKLMINRGAFVIQYV